MRIRLALTVDIERRRPEVASEEQHEHRDNDTLVETRYQPSHIGFRPDEPSPQ